MNRIVGGLICLAIIGSPTISYADGIIIPRSIKVGEFKKDMKNMGLDLYGRDDSDGEVINMGTSIKVITYAPVTPEKLDLIRKASLMDVRD